jgi:NADH-dependent peroxiredoxin subunit F
MLQTESGPKDLIVIGGGPAGITAAVYAARKMMDFTVITGDLGGQAAWSGDIENYTGYQFISGPDLAQKFREQLSQYKFELLEGVSVARIEKTGTNFKVVTGGGQEYLSRTLIVASGKRPRTLNVPGEETYKNHGLTYCATCDAPLFSGKEVAVVGGGNSALDAVLQLIKISPKIYLINIAEKLTGDPVMQAKVTASPKVEIMDRTKVVEIFGDKFVKGIKVESGGQIRTIGVEGVFVEAGLTPNTEFIELAKKNRAGEIIVNGAAETSVPGLFAAGDATDVPEKQIIIAAGEGAKAALAAFRFLAIH